MAAPVSARHLTTAELDAGVDEILQSPADDGVVRMIVRRPATDLREVVTEGELSLTEGLAGDSWVRRGVPRGASRPDSVATQLTVMNARAIALIAGDESRWALAGDQLFVDMDLSDDNLPALTQVAIGAAVIAVSAEPHTGCKKFVSRYGLDALTFVNSAEGRRLRLRGLNASVVQAGTVRVGDRLRRVT